MRARLIVALLFFVLLASACDRIAQQPYPFPKRAYLGETISIAIDTDSLYVGSKNFTLSSENVRIQLWDQGSDATFNLTPRGVITSATALGTKASEQDGATEISVAVFDLPSTLPAGFSTPPSDVWVMTLLYPSMEYVDGNVFPTVRILGPASQGDGATTFYPGLPEIPTAIEARLEPLPALRLRAKRPQFQHTWTIGSIQFEVVYPSSVSSPRAYSKITAAGALAYATGISTGRARVVLVDPKGFKLNAGGAPPTALGPGPFVDIAFNQSAPFSTSNFDIENLLVTDVNGNVLIDDPGNSEEYFELYARANQ